MFNSFGRQASQPITIKPIHQERHRHSGDLVPSDSEDEGIDFHLGADDDQDGLPHEHGDSKKNEHRRNLSASFLDSNFDNLTVGSLPSSRREKRLMVTRGNNERLAGRGGTSIRSDNLSTHRIRTSTNTAGINAYGSNRYGNMQDLSQSMPNAPSLASRRDRDSGARLSRIPSMRLPESVTDSEASSLPYGSLNESQFRFPLGNSRTDSDDRNFASSYSPRSRSGSLSKPGLGPSLDIQMRVQQMKKDGALVKNDVSGLASLFGARNDGDFDGDVKKKDERDGHTIGIGSQISEMGRRQEPSNEDNVKAGGIGSVIRQSSLSEQLQIQHQTTSSSSATCNRQSSITSTSSTSLGQNNYSFRDKGVDTNDGDQLSSSLTGLSILRTSPKNMVSLRQDEREALANLRSRTFEDDDRRNHDHENGDVNAIANGNMQSGLLGEISHPETSYNAGRRFSNGSNHVDEEGDDTGGGLFDFEMDI